MLSYDTVLIVASCSHTCLVRHLSSASCAGTWPCKAAQSPTSLLLAGGAFDISGARSTAEAVGVLTAIVAITSVGTLLLQSPRAFTSQNLQ